MWRAQPRQEPRNARRLPWRELIEEIERHGSTLESEAAKLHGHLSELGPQCLRALAGKGRVIPVKKAFPNEFQPFAHGVGGHAKMAAGESYFFSGNGQ